MSSFSPDSSKQLGCSPVPLVPPNEQMASLAVDDNTISNRPRSPDSRYNIQTGNFSPDSSKPHGGSRILDVPPNEQAISLKADDESLSPSNSPDSSNAASPSFFQLLETVSPHVQSVLLEQCNVLELSSIAVVSSSLRKGALATMANRSLMVRFVTNCGVDEATGQLVVRYEIMQINHSSDPSREEIIAIGTSKGEEYPCLSWRKIQKLLYFCGHAAAVKRIFYHNEPCYNPAFTAMRAGQITRTEWSLEELVVDEFISYTYDCFDMLKFISPRGVMLIFSDDELMINDTIIRARVHSVLHSRGMLSAESISIDFVNPLMSYAAITDELMLMLPASSITFTTLDAVFLCTVPKFIRWNPFGVSLFIEQWLRGSRVIKRVQSCLPMEGDPSVPQTDQEPVEFGKNLVEALGELKQPPQIDFSTSLNEDLKSQLQILDGEPIYNPGVGFSPKASVIRVTATDGRQITIVVAKGWDIKNNRSAKTGFIDIFPSS